MGVELSSEKLDSGWSDLLGEEFKEEREGPAGKEEVPAELPTEPPVMEAEHPPAETEPIAILPAEIPARIRLKVAIDGGPDIGVLPADSEHDVTEIDSDGDLWIAVNDDANDGLCVPADAYEVVAWKPAMVAGGREGVAPWNRSSLIFLKDGEGLPRAARMSGWTPPAFPLFSPTTSRTSARRKRLQWQG